MPFPKNKAQSLAHKLFRLPLKLQLLFLYGLLMTIMTVSSCWLINAETQDANKHQADTIGELLSQQTASAVTNMLVTGDRLSLSILLNNLVKNPYILEASIYSIDNQRIGHATAKGIRSTKPTGPNYTAPINYQEVIAGYVHLSLNQTLLTQKPREAIQLIFAISALLLICGMTVIYFFGDQLTTKLRLIERQLHSILPLQPAAHIPGGDIERIAAFVEHQLTEKHKTSDKETEVIPENEVSALLSIRTKNLSRLQQLVAPQDLANLLSQQTAIIAASAKCYDGTVSYSPEGNSYIRFSSLGNRDFALNAVLCGLLIERLSESTEKQSIAKIQTGSGLCLSDNTPEYPEEHHPALDNSAASQALMLAGLPGQDGFHMLRQHLSWLPPGSVNFELSDHGEDILLIHTVSEEAEDDINRQQQKLTTQLLAGISDY